MFKSRIKTLFIWPTNGTLPHIKDAVFWIIWYVGAVILIDGVLTNSPFELGYSMSNTYFIGMLPLVLAFHNKTYVREVLFSKYKNLSIAIFRHTLIFIVIITALPIALDYNYGLVPLIRESTIIIYWLLSLILLFVENIIIRYLGAIFIYAVCLLYSTILQDLYLNFYYISFTYMICICGSCTFALAVTLFVIKKRMYLCN